MSSTRKTSVRSRPNYLKNEAKSQSVAKKQSNSKSSYLKTPVFSHLLSNSLIKPKPSTLTSKPLNSAPGPGSYDPIDTSHSYSCLILGKPKEEPVSNSPGPGSYSPDLHNSSPAYSVSQSLRFQNLSTGPGPSDYDIQDLKPCSPSFKIGNSTRVLPFSQLESLDTTPGPGYYSPDQRNHSPSAIFSSTREKSLIQTPGPGDYEINKPKTYPKAAEYSIPKSSRPDIVRNNYPGPSDYNTTSSNRLSRGTFSKSVRSSSARSESPGPNYNPPSSLSNLGGVIGLKTPLKTTPSPGPGSYSARDKPKSQAFSFGRSKKFQETEASPVSPASYCPSLHSTRLQPRFARSPRKELFTAETGISMQSLSDSSKDLRLSTPGPGSYDPKCGLFSPQFSIGRSPRFERINPSPGPADYSPFRNEESPERTLGLAKTSRLSRITKITDTSLNKPSGNYTYVKYCEQSPPKTRKNHYDQLKQSETFT